MARAVGLPTRSNLYLLSHSILYLFKSGATDTGNTGILPDGLVIVVNVQWFGSAALELTYKTATGKVANELLYRHDEPRAE